MITLPSGKDMLLVLLGIVLAEAIVFLLVTISALFFLQLWEQL